MPGKSVIEKLGTRQEKRMVVESRPDPETGAMTKVETMKKFEVVQGYLTPEEAALLPKNLDWKEHGMKHGHGKYVAICEGRKFFVDEIPHQKEDKK